MLLLFFSVASFIATYLPNSTALSTSNTTTTGTSNNSSATLSRKENWI
jgi:hypothetical protein